MSIHSQPLIGAGFDLLGPQQPLDERGVLWIGRAQEWATGVTGIALYSDESRYDFHLLLFLLPEQARTAMLWCMNTLGSEGTEERREASCNSLSGM